MVPLVVVTIAVVALGVRAAQATQVSYFDVPHGAHPHDVAPAPDGTVWYTAQHQGAIGILDPKTGKVIHVSLGSGAAPHGVIVGPDRAAWITESGQNAIARVDPETKAVQLFPLPKEFPGANLNTATFDRKGSYGLPVKVESTVASIPPPARLRHGRRRKGSALMGSPRRREERFGTLRLPAITSPKSIP